MSRLPAQFLEPTTQRSAQSLKLLAESEGDLALRPARQILADLHRARFSGHVAFSQGTLRKKLYFAEGEIFKVQSNLSQELLGRGLCAAGWLSAERLEHILALQAKILGESKRLTRLGDILLIEEKIPAEEIERVAAGQELMALLQAFTWTEGHFSWTSQTWREAPEARFHWDDLVQAAESFMASLAIESEALNLIRPWKVSVDVFDVAIIPLWSVLWGLRFEAANGILNLEREGKLFELVIKNGIPMTLYEGTLAQPRQTLVIRRMSEEHELHFTQEVFSILGSTSGLARFHSLGTYNASEIVEESRHEPLPESFGEHSVTVSDPWRKEALDGKSSGARGWINRLSSFMRKFMG